MVLPLVLLIVLIWEKVHIVVAALICTALMAGLNIFDVMTESYMAILSSVMYPVAPHAG
jgi:uncharacterized membrane protein